MCLHYKVLAMDTADHILRKCEIWRNLRRDLRLTREKNLNLGNVNGAILDSEKKKMAFLFC